MVVTPAAAELLDRREMRPAGLGDQDEGLGLAALVAYSLVPWGFCVGG